jgi:hypothetical protein
MQQRRAFALQRSPSITTASAGCSAVAAASPPVADDTVDLDFDLDMADLGDERDSRPVAGGYGEAASDLQLG